ncbi:hypothetical protein EUX98_g7838 [Antrodiella citrinella]|uniref:Uncharacterized protein n=1 Tax=Antrodiella citrinella TaxID=2447956 RepID=A0A4S4MKU8_9APHY|nr:hypothetical protein EUX98_g7838 [Antrodiella citrinella]
MSPKPSQEIKQSQPTQEEAAPATPRGPRSAYSASSFVQIENQGLEGTAINVDTWSFERHTYPISMWADTRTPTSVMGEDPKYFERMIQNLIDITMPQWPAEIPKSKGIANALCRVSKHISSQLELLKFKPTKYVAQDIIDRELAMTYLGATWSRAVDIQKVYSPTQGAAIEGDASREGSQVTSSWSKTLFGMSEATSRFPWDAFIHYFATDDSGDSDTCHPIVEVTIKHCRNLVQDSTWPTPDSNGKESLDKQFNRASAFEVLCRDSQTTFYLDSTTNQFGRRKILAFHLAGCSQEDVDKYEEHREYKLKNATARAELWKQQLNERKKKHQSHPETHPVPETAGNPNHEPSTGKCDMALLVPIRGFFGSLMTDRGHQGNCKKFRPVSLPDAKVKAVATSEDKGEPESVAEVEKAGPETELKEITGSSAQGISLTVTAARDRPPVDPAATSAAVISKGANLQTFAGALGNVTSPPVTQLANGQFQVTGNSAFNTLSDALTRSCDVQHNQCANAANAAGNKGDLTVTACGDQQTQCDASR